MTFQRIEVVKRYYLVKGWKLLWLKRIKTKLPDSAPDMKWAYQELAKLGGWKNTKRTGRASVKRMAQITSHP
ncbi:hypothetical protein N482_17320 [Pseudoalteromonas luteoviolacea NCIMB 1942]|uniref:Uncharacterized protein n=1 Tax=Pseudoalteromonas luteoviolacea NCIMB 1942 TaxID=1365253 RepID=A0A166ZC81_9GAMM|nr:hypothetical protein N482_17320 [Pseudoalteromonas luteoviolacea NCIMB 1942]